MTNTKINIISYTVIIIG